MEPTTFVMIIFGAIVCNFLVPVLYSEVFPSDDNEDPLFDYIVNKH